jgi:hypothetical protein
MSDGVIDNTQGQFATMNVCDGNRSDERGSACSKNLEPISKYEEYIGLVDVEDLANSINGPRKGNSRVLSRIREVIDVQINLIVD